VTQRPLYERDPEAWRAHLAEGNARQPRKRVGADALIRDERGRVLIVDPTYKPDWDLPGGMAEANEAPTDALARELKEELGLDLSPGRLLCVDWVPPHGPWDDSMMFIFDSGTLHAGQADQLHPTDDELATIRFVSPATAVDLLRPAVGRRLQHALTALKETRTIYLHDGTPLSAPQSPRS
jgi:8-oxo-dGTP diphosphatase